MYTIEDRTLGPRPGPPIPIPIQNVEARSPPLGTTHAPFSFGIPDRPSAENKEGRTPEKNKNTEEEEMI